MTTPSPAYYRNIITSILTETNDAYQLPQWFVAAWTNDDVEIVPVTPSVYQYRCSFQIEWNWLTAVVLKFVVRQRPAYRITDIGAEMIFDKAPKAKGIDPSWDQFKTRIRVLLDITDILSTITRASVPVEFESITWYPRPTVATVDFSTSFKNYLIEQLSPAAEQLFYWAKDR